MLFDETAKANFNSRLSGVIWAIFPQGTARYRQRSSGLDIAEIGN